MQFDHAIINEIYSIISDVDGIPDEIFDKFTDKLGVADKQIKENEEAKNKAESDRDATNEKMKQNDALHQRALKETAKCMRYIKELSFEGLDDVKSLTVDDLEKVQQKYLTYTEAGIEITQNQVLLMIFEVKGLHDITALSARITLKDIRSLFNLSKSKKYSETTYKDTIITGLLSYAIHLVNSANKDCNYGLTWNNSKVIPPSNHVYNLLKDKYINFERCKACFNHILNSIDASLTAALKQSNTYAKKSNTLSIANLYQMLVHNGVIGNNVNITREELRAFRDEIDDEDILANFNTICKLTGHGKQYNLNTIKKIDIDSVFFKDVFRFFNRISWSFDPAGKISDGDIKNRLISDYIVGCNGNDVEIFGVIFKTWHKHAVIVYRILQVILSLGKTVEQQFETPTRMRFVKASNGALSIKPGTNKAAESPGSKTELFLCSDSKLIDMISNKESRDYITSLLDSTSMFCELVDTNILDKIRRSIKRGRFNSFIGYVDITSAKTIQEAANMVIEEIEDSNKGFINSFIKYPYQININNKVVSKVSKGDGTMQSMINAVNNEFRDNYDNMKFGKNKIANNLLTSLLEQLKQHKSVEHLALKFNKKLYNLKDADTSVLKDLIDERYPY